MLILTSITLILVFLQEHIPLILRYQVAPRDYHAKKPKNLPWLTHLQHNEGVLYILVIEYYNKLLFLALFGL